jgi:hypothetical protein
VETGEQKAVILSGASYSRILFGCLGLEFWVETGEQKAVILSGASYSRILHAL